jgi:molecular chaperone GrpE (heat shock protein)
MSVPILAAARRRRARRTAAEMLATERLKRIIDQIDFDSERYYNLFSEPETGPDGVQPEGGSLAAEAWTNLSTLTADFTKLRGEVYRLSRGVEQLRLPAIEAVGLDKVAEQLRALELKLRPLSEVLNRSEEDSRIKRLLKDLLDVADSLDRVFDLLEKQGSDMQDGLVRGIRAVYDLLLTGMARAGLIPMEVGETFDPHMHMAMGTEPAPGKPDGAVSRVLVKGWLWHGQVFRTAQVAVVRN